MLEIPTHINHISHLSLTITSAYAAALACLFVYLAIRVIGLRRSSKIPIGNTANSNTNANASVDAQSNIDIQNKQLLLIRAIRAHANFAEYIPFALILMALLEMQGFAPILLHILGLLLLLGRLLHAYGISQTRENFAFRVGGMICTFTAMISMVMGLLWQSFF